MSNTLRQREPRLELPLWLAAVRSVGYCVRCGAGGPTDAAHRDFGKGLSMKTDDCCCASLCRACHISLGEGRDWTREERRAEMDAAIVETLRVLARRGLVVARKLVA